MNKFKLKKLVLAAALLSSFFAQAQSVGGGIYGNIPVTGITGLGTGVATALAVNIGSVGAPVLFNGAGGTPSSLTLTSATGLPVSTGLTGAGTGILTALGVNVGSAGAPVLFNGAGGTPSSITLTNASGTAASLTAGIATVAGTVTTAAQPAITSVGTLTGLTVATGITVTSAGDINSFWTRNSTSNSSATFFKTGATSDFLVGQMGLPDSDYSIYSYGLGAQAFIVARATGNTTITRTLTLSNIPSSTGVRFLCISTAGVVTSQAAACVGT